jgi:hypothetical protein
MKTLEDVQDWAEFQKEDVDKKEFFLGLRDDEEDPVIRDINKQLLSLYDILNPLDLSDTDKIEYLKGLMEKLETVTFWIEHDIKKLEHSQHNQ